MAANSAFGEIKEMEMEEIRELYHCLEKGYNSYPLNLPGTSYWKAIKVDLIFFFYSIGLIVYLQLYINVLKFGD